MTGHPFDNEFAITGKQQEQFQRDGFVKLEGFLNAPAVDMLLDRVVVELARDTGSEFTRSTASVLTRGAAAFSKVEYDFDTAKSDVFELLERPYFRQALTGLTGRDLFLTFELSFEIEKNVNKGLPWHVGVQSFGYQFAEEFGCTLWAPLHPIDTSGQRGGMSYVPQGVLPGDFVYPADLAVVEALRARERSGRRTSVQDYVDLRFGLLNSPVMDELLAVHQVEDDFRPGDVLLFNKTVAHRSIPLGEGELDRRAAYVMRFVDAASRYDLNRAQTLEFPAEQYGEGPFGYKPVTRQHIEIAEAGAADGDLLSECAYFSDRDRRLLQRTPDDAAAQAGSHRRVDSSPSPP